MIVAIKGIKGTDGSPGLTGPAGTGSTINISEDGSLVASNISNLNFEGNVEVVDNTGSATVTVGSTSNIQCYSTITTNLNSATPIQVSWDAEDLKDTADFIHSNTVNPSRLYVNTSGWYEVSYSVYYSDATNRTNVRSRVRKNGDTYVGRGTTVAYTRDNPNDSGSNSAGPFLLQLVANDYIELMCDEQGDPLTVALVANDNYIRMTLFRKV